MNKEFITLKEAGKLVGVSPMTIRRYAFKLLKSKKDEVKANVKVPSKTNYPYKIAKDKVLKKFDKEQVKESYNGNNENVKKSLTNIDNKLLETLTEQLKVKDEQIKAKDEQINALSERLKESHVLLLGQPKTSPEPTVFEDQEKTKPEAKVGYLEPSKEDLQETIEKGPSIAKKPTEAENEDPRGPEEARVQSHSEESNKKGLMERLFG